VRKNFFSSFPGIYSSARGRASETCRAIISRPAGAGLEVTMDDLEGQFHEEMLNIYRRAKSEAGYPASIFLKMVVERGGLETAKYLLHTSDVSDGYTALWERGRLDLTVEAVMLDLKWHPLFSDQERQVAIDRLPKYEYSGTLPGH
jgi:hypothetical protein